MSFGDFYMFFSVFIFRSLVRVMMDFLVLWVLSLGIVSFYIFLFLGVIGRIEV